MKFYEINILFSFFFNYLLFTLIRYLDMCNQTQYVQIGGQNVQQYCHR